MKIKTIMYVVSFEKAGEVDYFRFDLISIWNWDGINWLTLLNLVFLNLFR